MKNKYFTLLATAILLMATACPVYPQTTGSPSFSSKTDTLIWVFANRFTAAFNAPDTQAMKSLIPGDFMLQWMHENFLGKRNLLNAMRDSAVHETLRHDLIADAGTAVVYSDDGNAASLNTSFCFRDPGICESITKKNQIGLCIMYFQKTNGVFQLRTVHYDLHCTLCN